MPVTAKLQSFEQVSRIQQVTDARLDSVEMELNGIRDILKEAAKLSKEAMALSKETAAQSKALDERFEKELVQRKEESAQRREDLAQRKEDLAQRKEELVQRQRELNERAIERDRDYAAWKSESARLEKEFRESIKEINERHGELTDSHGKFVEHMARPAIVKLIENTFNGEYRGRLQMGDGQNNLEIDALGVSKHKNPQEVFVFEIKRTFRSSCIDQVHQHIRKLRLLLPHLYQDSPIYGFIAAAVVDEADARKCWKNGIQLLQFSDGVFEVKQPPSNFRHTYDYGIRKVSGRVEKSVPPPFYLEQLQRVTAVAKYTAPY